MKAVFFLLLNAFLFAEGLVAQAQTNPPMIWHNPALAEKAVVEGRLWQTGLNQFYDRLPAKATGLVRTEVMNLAHNSAGTYIRFHTSAKKISIRYQVSGGLQFPHMPATGVSGVDLYAQEISGNWQWVRGRYQFGDTIRYDFPSIDSTVRVREYRLYLPLYNTVRWMEIGVPENQPLQWAAPETAAPIILYGTSILQGACASRAGLAWTNILGRNLSTPLVNLGFSGNGRMEKELIDLIAEHPAKLVVLDCMPNLSDLALYPKEELLKRYRYAVETIRKTNPNLPLILTEHCCGLPGTNMDLGQRAGFATASITVAEIYQALVKEGFKNLHLLTATAIGFDKESTVDGVHPNDIGMLKYARAYEQLIKKILWR